MDRRIPIFTPLIALSLLALGAGAVAAQSAQMLAPAAQPEMSAACAASQEQCTVNCLGHGEWGPMVSCLMACDNAAAACALGEEPTLSSEWYLEQGLGNLLGTKSGACHDTTPCAPEYSSCGSWSGYSDCGDPWCGVYKFCGDDCGETFCFGEATRQFRERFRVCFNQQAQACTEYQRISTVVGCGC